MTNNGTIAATNIVVSEDLTVPANVTVDSITPSTGTYADLTTIMPGVRLGELLIYYGFPSLINGAGGVVATAAADFGQYDHVVLGAGLEDPGHGDGVNVAAGDVTGDGIPDIIVGPGSGGGPNVKVFDGVTGAVVKDFFAYDLTFMGGVFVGAGDFNGDRLAVNVGMSHESLAVPDAASDADDDTDQANADVDRSTSETAHTIMANEVQWLDEPLGDDGSQTTDAFFSRDELVTLLLT